MQILSAYLIESGTLSPADATDRQKAVSAAIHDWLSQKGVQDVLQDRGTFASLTASTNGTFSRKRITNELGTLEETRLEELTRGGQTFTTVLSLAAVDSIVTVHATLSVTNTSSIIAPLLTDPRCPSVIRKIIELYPDWTFNGTPLGVIQNASFFGEEAAKQLVDDIRSDQRSLPIVVVSQIEGEPVWPYLGKELAFDLTGLAKVVTIDEEAGWTLTNEIGKKNSCYLGAVRLYWPVKRTLAHDGQFPSTVWTASRLLSNDYDGRGMDRFRGVMRRTVMSVAALTVEPPSNIGQIHNLAGRKQLRELEERADANSEDIALARLFIEENEQLKAQLSRAQSEIAKQSSRAEAAEFALGQSKLQVGQNEQEQGNEVEAAPKAGETRFYKKTHSKPVYDVLVRVADCGHTSWQSAAKADKAKKGVERLEGRSNWKSIQHCGSCTGGGMWKVRW